MGLIVGLTSSAESCERLGRVYKLDELVDEVQVIVGELDEDVLPKKSIEKHIDLSTFEIASLLNTLAAPWYGVQPAITITNTNTNGEGLMDIRSVIKVDAITIGLDKIVAVVLNKAPGTTRKARDWSQYVGVAYGGNSQFSESYMWIHHGMYLNLWAGTDTVNSGDGTTGKIIAYRQVAPLSSGTFTGADVYIDLPDKYVPLVISKTVLWAMKQKKMGNWQEVSGEVDQGIKGIQADFDKSLQSATQKVQLEGVET